MTDAYPDPISFLVHETGLSAGIVTIVLLLTVSWTIIWKGVGLWNAARDGQKWWFLAFLIINDLGILELIYLFGIRKRLRNKTASLFDQPVTPSESQETSV